MPRQHISIAYMVPNLVTLGSLCCGLSSIRFAMAGRWELAIALLIIASILDGLDGRIARMLKATSTFGAQLDSLCDFMCFGVAPVFVMYLWKLHEIRGFGWAVVLFFAICSALRLARFNTSLVDGVEEPWQKHFFTGVPAPAGAMLALFPLVLSLQFGWFDNRYAVALYVLPIAFLMISKVPTLSIKSHKVPRSSILPITLIAVAIIIGFITEPWITFTLIAVGYLASIPVTLLQRRAFNARYDNSEDSAQI